MKKENTYLKEDKKMRYKVGWMVKGEEKIPLTKLTFVDNK